ncbi:DUF2255 family protein [Actinoplanes sp. NEAU-A12]|uniref:DUF2255 family protein n=1 Tax=Actinoplanes sandaracinus TaxID=3045177 RepID=A0ABT6WTH8_9ACTN|nr:DUF2255 family protein [Actinoplanes sandaracinus]MDI6103033.1 DUF2255 family protein [Actinoplanes sandaracinus]
MPWEASIAADLAGAREIDVIVPAPERPVVRAPIWIVAVDGDLYVRSWKGEAGRWYRRAHRYGTGSLAMAGREHPVRFVPAAEPGLDARIDQAYLHKYGDSSYAPAMTRPPAAGTTMRVEPAS